MPPRNIWKNVTYVRPSQNVDEETAGIINELLDEIYSNLELRNDIDHYLAIANSKISAIKHLKEYFEKNALPVRPTYTLRNFKDTIDHYQYKFNILTKIKMLRDRIEKWCEQNGYEKMDNQKTLKDNKTGEYTYRYTDWEMVDDHVGLMINDREWLPSPNQLKQYNKLWKKYSNVRNLV